MEKGSEERRRVGEEGVEGAEDEEAVVVGEDGVEAVAEAVGDVVKEAAKEDSMVWVLAVV